jgi:hypothetical protein
VVVADAMRVRLGMGMVLRVLVPVVDQHVLALVLLGLAQLAQVQALLGLVLAQQDKSNLMK